MQRLEDSTPLLAEPAALSLRDRLRESGHLFFRGLVDADRVLGVRAAVLEVLRDRQWVLAGGPDDDAIAGPRARGEGATPDDEFLATYAQIQRLQVFHELAHDDALVRVVADLVGDTVLVHPRKIFRITTPQDPRAVTPPHQDHRLIQGAVDTLTAWVPIGACPVEQGGLRVHARLHRAGLQPIRAATGTGGVVLDVDGMDDVDGSTAAADEWLTADFEAGDVLVFHSLTVHAALPNRSRSLRLSADFRYQAASEPIERHALDPHWFPRIPGWNDLTAGWTSTRSIESPAAPVTVEFRDAFAPDFEVDRPALLTID